MDTKVQKLLYDRRSATFELSISVRLLDYYIADQQIRFPMLSRNG